MKIGNMETWKHGKMGFKEEGESFAEIACTKGWQVLSVDGPEFERYLFASPVLNMQRHILSQVGGVRLIFFMLATII